MSLQTRLNALVAAIGADIKAINSRTTAVLVRARKTTDTNYTTAAAFQGPISFSTEDTDDNNYWNGSKFLPTRAGWYRLGATAALSGMTSGALVELHIVKNGTLAAVAANNVASDLAAARSDGWALLQCQDLVYFNGTTDYAEVYVFVPNPANLRGTSSDRTTFTVESVGAAGPTGATGPQGPGTTILSRVNELVDAQESGSAVEWRLAGNLLAKIVGMNPLVGDIISTRTEMWLRAKSSDGTKTQSRLLLDSDGNSDFFPVPVTALPTTAPNGGPLVDGQECYFLPGAPAPNDKVVWHLKYMTFDSKWHFVGGPPLLVEVTNQDSTGSTGAYVAITNAGPSIAIPIAGEYLVSQGAVHNSNTASANSYMSYDIGATGAVDADGIFWQNSTALNAYTPGTRTRRKTLTAVTLTSKYKASAGVSTFRDRWMSVLPVRLG